MPGEFRGDFTRDTFDPLKHFSRVLMQQGRVQLDADWNEQASILLHYLQTLAADLVGPNAGPADALSIAPRPAAPKPDFMITRGHYYVGGILCDNDRRDPEGNAVDVAYTDQNDYPLPDESQLQKGATYLVYLDVWERHITYIEDEAKGKNNPSIRDVALAGRDTATRAKVVWQVKVLPLVAPPPNTPQDAELLLENTLFALSTTSLSARAKRDEASTDPCVIKPTARFRGAENQLYRVEIHTGSRDRIGRPATPTFKWSRENGSVIFPIQLAIAVDATAKKTTVTLAHLGRDLKLSLAEGDWVEIVDDVNVLQHHAEPLLRVTSIDRDEMKVTLDGTPILPVGNDLTKHPLLRRWDSRGEVQVEPPASNAPWIPLEDGIEVKFEPGSFCRTGDFWLIPARTATGDVDWPGLRDVPDPLPPHGVHHRFAPLAVIALDANGDVKIPVKDLRRKFNKLTIP